MESEQFASLGDRITLQDFNEDHPNPSEEKQSTVEIARRLNFILFEEIIESSPAQSRTVIFDPKIFKEDEELLKSIQTNGIVTPITVRELEKEGQVNDPFRMKKQGERCFALVAGHRRVAAGRAAGLAGAEGVIAKSSDDHTLITLVENMGRRGLTTYEKARALKSLQERKGLSGNKTAQLVGISQATINRRFNALKSPEVLRNLWQEEKMSDTAIVTLKKHWHDFEELENSIPIGQLKGLSMSEAESLRDQLGAGTQLETALIAIQKIDKPNAQKKSKPAAQTKQADSTTDHTTVDNQENTSFDKEALMTAIQDVFPRLKSDKRESIYTSTLFYGNQDPKILWAAALFISKGGKVDTAINLSIKVLSNRTIASLIKRQVQLTKLSASLYKKYWKKNPDIKQYLKTVFR